MSAEEHCNSPLAIPHCKYTSKTHPKLWQDAAPAPASFMNVTPRERKMITLQRRQGGGTGGGGRKREKKNHFDGLCPSWDNLVTFLDRILTRPDSLLQRWFSFFSHLLLSSQTCAGCDNCAQRWYLMIPLAGTNYYQWLREETWLLPHMLSLGGGAF